MVALPRIPSMLAEMARVAKPGATVAISLPTAGSFGEFYSLYWELLHTCNLQEHESYVEGLITELLTTAELEEIAEHAGLEEVSSWSRIEEFNFDSGERFVNSPLVSDFLMNRWLEFIPEESRECIRQAIPRIVNDDRHDAEFTLSVKATLVAGHKGHSH
ncbi:MAG TPA: hypothetical protein VFD48_04740, partial [Pyrinomonadaceae bacterium]|nr:hypothetical protein [Pyrinomonadaceae bacterium]